MAIEERRVMRYLLSLSFIFVLGCATTKNETPLKYTYLPPYLSFDSVKTSSKDTVYHTDSPKFDPIAVFSGSKLVYNGITSDLKPGLLICERDYGTCLIYKARMERLAQENAQEEKLRRETYDASVKAENIYQKRIVELDKSNKRSWLEKNAFFIGLAIGAGAIVAGDVALIYITK